MKTRHIVELFESVKTLEQLVSDLQSKIREVTVELESLKNEIESHKTPRATQPRKSSK